jgi:acetyltransferase
MPPRSIELRDGRAVDARPVRARDAGQVQAFVRALSPQSRRERFFAPIAELSPRQLERVVSGPGLSLAAWQPGGSVVGLAQYALGEHEAEFAVVVAEDWRGNGPGGALVGMLLAHAAGRGVRVFGGVALGHNRAMRLLAAKLGFAFRRDEDPALLRMERLLAA